MNEEIPTEFLKQYRAGVKTSPTWPQATFTSRRDLPLLPSVRLLAVALANCSLAAGTSHFPERNCSLLHQQTNHLAHRQLITSLKVTYHLALATNHFADQATKYFSASNAAIVPSATAVVICLYSFFLTSPAA